MNDESGSDKSPLYQLDLRRAQTFIAPKQDVHGPITATWYTYCMYRYVAYQNTATFFLVSQAISTVYLAFQGISHTVVVDTLHDCTRNEFLFTEDGIRITAEGLSFIYM